MSNLLKDTLRIKRLSHDVLFLGVSTVVSILAAAVTLLYIDHLRMEETVIQEFKRSEEKRDSDLQQAMFRFDVFYSTDRILETQISNQQVDKDIRSLIARTVFLDRRMPFNLMLQTVAVSKKAYDQVLKEYDMLTEKARNHDATAYSELLQLESKVYMSAQHEIDRIRLAHKESQEKIAHLESRRSSAVVVGFTLQQLGAVCAVVAVLLGRKAHGVHIHQSHELHDIS
jgi:hypothetical protein